MKQLKIIRGDFNIDELPHSNRSDSFYTSHTLLKSYDIDIMNLSFQNFRTVLMFYYRKLLKDETAKNYSW